MTITAQTPEAQALVTEAIEALTKAYDDGKLWFSTKEFMGQKQLVVKGSTYDGREFFKLAGFKYKGHDYGVKPQWILPLDHNNVYAMSKLAEITHDEKVFQIGSIFGSPAYALNVK